MMVFEAESIEAVRKIVEKDVYYTGGVVRCPRTLCFTLEKRCLRADYGFSGIRRSWRLFLGSLRTHCLMRTSRNRSCNEGLGQKDFVLFVPTMFAVFEASISLTVYDKATLSLY
jgi:hypothetical protein